MKTKAELIKEFKNVVKGANFMTPTILEFIEIKNGVCELSKGKGIFSEFLFGVTCVINNKKAEDVSTCFQTKDEALTYIQTLK